MVRRRVLVHLCPAVPTAPNRLPRRAMSRSACSETMIALLPPSSSKALPSLAPTASPTALPMRVEPVAEINGMRLSFAVHSPTFLPPTTRLLTPSGTLFLLKTSDTMFWQAKAQSGVFSEGFHTHTSPQTQASILFQLQTATGKLKAEMIPTIPRGCHCSYIR